MLNCQQIEHIKDVLGDGLGINRNIRLSYFAVVQNNQRVLNDKLDRILSSLQNR